MTHQPGVVHTEKRYPVDVICSRSARIDALESHAMVMPVARCMAVLAAFSPAQVWKGKTEISKETGISASTVSRLLQSLASLGYLRFDPQRRKYRLAAACLAIGYASVVDAAIQREIYTGMQNFADATGSYAVLAARDRLEMVVLGAWVGKGVAMDLRLLPGTRLHIASSVIGAAFLAAIPENERTYLQGKMESKAGDEWTSLQRRMNEKISQVRELGYCMSIGEWKRGLGTIAVPFLAPNHPPLILACTNRNVSISFMRAGSEYGPRLVELSQLLQQRMTISRRTSATVNEKAMHPQSEEGITRTRDQQSVTRTVKRSLEVLCAFNAERSMLSNADLAHRTCLSKATVSRLTTTLCRIGYLRRAGGGRQFELDSGVFGIGHAYLETNPITHRVNPILQKLADNLDACVALAVPHHLNMLYIACRASARISTLRLEAGALIPMKSTSAGHAYLYALPTENRLALKAALLNSVGSDSFRVEKCIDSAFEDLRESGVCMSIGECQCNTYGISLSIRVGGSRTLMTLSCGAIELEPDVLAIRNRVIPELKSAASRICELLDSVDCEP